MNANTRKVSILQLGDQSLDHYPIFLEEVIGDQVKDPARLEHIVFQESDQPLPKEQQDHRLHCDEHEEDSLNYRLVVRC